MVFDGKEKGFSKQRQAFSLFYPLPDFHPGGSCTAGNAEALPARRQRLPAYKEGYPHHSPLHLTQKLKNFLTLVLVLNLIVWTEKNPSSFFKMTVVNQSSEIVELFWVGADNKEISYGLVPPNTQVPYNTYANHEWVARSQLGIFLQRFTMPSADQSFTVLETTNGDFKDGYHLPTRFPNEVSLGFPRNKNRLSTKGKVIIAVLFSDYPDATSRETPESYYQNLSPKGENFLSTVSYGAMEVNFRPYFKWIRLKESSAFYSPKLTSRLSHIEFIQSVVDEVSSDFSWLGVESIVLLSPTEAKFPHGLTFIGSESDYVRAGEFKIKNGQTSGKSFVKWDGFFFPHECGHSMSLPDLYDLSWDRQGDYSLLHRHVGGFSLMGFAGGKCLEYFAFERWQLGWINDDQVIFSPKQGGTFTITAIEIPHGKKMIIVPIDITKALVIESRRAIGFDSKCAKTGALIYLVDTSVRKGKGPIVVQAKDMEEPYKDHAPLALGESLTCFGVKVNCVGADEFTDTVRVEF